MVLDEDADVFAQGAANRVQQPLQDLVLGSDRQRAVKINIRLGVLSIVYISRDCSGIWGNWQNRAFSHGVWLMRLSDRVPWEMPGMTVEPASGRFPKSVYLECQQLDWLASDERSG